METDSPNFRTEFEDIDLLRKLAEGISKRGMGIPTIFFLEMYKPMAGILNAGLDASAPIVESIFGWSRFKDAKRILSSRENVEKIICLIEEHEKTLNSKQKSIKRNIDP